MVTTEQEARAVARRESMGDEVHHVVLDEQVGQHVSTSG
jgi:hypothetical protein